MKELEDIFGVPTDGSNIDAADDSSEESQENAYAAVASESDETFEDKANVLKTALASSVASDSEEVENTDISEEEETSSEPEQETQDLGSIIEAASNASKAGEKPSAVEEIRDEQSSDNSVASESSDGEDEREDGSVSGSDSILPEEDRAEEPIEVSEPISETGDQNEDLRKQGFLVDAPSKLYEAFFDMKIQAIRTHLLNNEKLPIDKYMREMTKAYVPIKVNLTDTETLSNKMQEIQRNRDRIIQIKTYVNYQYFRWKRLVTMMHGQLARIIYEKPAAKQEGVIYEHMRDLEEYYNDIESAYETTKDIIANLDAAYDNLSRQVTLAMPNKSSHIRQDHGRNATVEIEESDYDKLSVKSSGSQLSVPKEEESGPKQVSFGS